MLQGVMEREPTRPWTRRQVVSQRARQDGEDGRSSRARVVGEGIASMTVYIAHAEADAAAAASLKEGLARQGVFPVELEPSERSGRPLGGADVVVALVSKSSPFDP